MMLPLNFSGSNTETLKDANDGFTKEVRSKANLFLACYSSEHFSSEERERITQHAKPGDILRELFDLLDAKGLRKSVFVVIDEYDHFANNILSQGKSMFKQLVRTDGYVRPFYEALKKGTENVVDRIFITGVLPVLLDSLTSGFNIGKNKSTDEQFNEMFGFTEEEIQPIIERIGTSANRDEIRRYYNGYRFSLYANAPVYNSDMILYYASEFNGKRGAPLSMIDPNVISDYRKIRAILSLGERSLEEEILTSIVQQRQIAIKEITPTLTLTTETEFRFDEDALSSLLFYMGYLTIAEKQGFGTTLTIPNLVLESLYLDYMEHLLQQRGNIQLRSREKLEMWQDLASGKIEKLIELTEKMLKGLSNRDYERFDEKYIKVVMLSLLSDVNIYIPTANTKSAPMAMSISICKPPLNQSARPIIFFELKYVKARAAKRMQEKKAEEGRQQLQVYLSQLRAYVLVFRKDRCVQRIQVD